MMVQIDAWRQILTVATQYLDLPEAHIRAADPKLYFASVNEK
jgi:hypothetical protein